MTLPGLNNRIIVNRMIPKITDKGKLFVIKCLREQRQYYKRKGLTGRADKLTRHIEQLQHEWADCYVQQERG